MSRVTTLLLLAILVASRAGAEPLPEPGSTRAACSDSSLLEQLLQSDVSIPLAELGGHDWQDAADNFTAAAAQAALSFSRLHRLTSALQQLVGVQSDTPKQAAPACAAVAALRRLLASWDDAVFACRGLTAEQAMQHLSELDAAVAALASCDPMQQPLAASRRLAVAMLWKLQAALAAHGGGSPSALRQLQPRVQRTLVMLQLLHQDSLASRGIIEFTHISKTGGALPVQCRSCYEVTTRFPVPLTAIASRCCLPGAQAPRCATSPRPAAAGHRTPAGTATAWCTAWTMSPPGRWATTCAAGTAATCSSPSACTGAPTLCMPPRPTARKGGRACMLRTQCQRRCTTACRAAHWPAGRCCAIAAACCCPLPYPAASHGCLQARHLRSGWLALLRL